MKTLFKLFLLPLSAVFASQLSAQESCQANYAYANQWGNGAQVALTVSNSASLSAWQVCWQANAGEQVADLWGGSFTQSGTQVCVSNMSYNGAVNAGSAIDIGFILNNPAAQLPSAFTLNGRLCNGLVASSSSSSSLLSSSSSVPPSSSSVSSSSSSSTVSSLQSSSQSSSVAVLPARWLLDAEQSNFHFVSVKNINTAETFTLSQFRGSVSQEGRATLSIPLATISTGFAIRNTRVQNLLFESAYLPHLHFTTELDVTALDELPVGAVSVQTIQGELTLHAITKPISFAATLVKHSPTSISVSPRRPIIINSVDFELNAGIEALRQVANQTSIGEKSPVYFKMFLTRDNPQAVAAEVLPAAPSAPFGLAGDVNSVGDANLTWVNLDSAHSGFTVRRKGADGRWATQAHLAALSTQYIQSLLDSPGNYDYKIISYTESIPSLASNNLALTYEVLASSSSSSLSSSSSSDNTGNEGSSSSNSSSSSSSDGGILPGDATRGANLWVTEGCIGCHGVDGERNASGSPAMAPLNPNRAVYRYSQDNQDRSLRDFIELWMPLGNPTRCTGQCAADLEAYIHTWRRPSDGIPDNPVAYFSCPNTSTAYGQRTLRLLTKPEYQRTVLDLVGYNQDVISRLPDDFIAGSFMNNNTLIVDRNRYTSYLLTAERIAEDVAGRWNSVLGCSATQSSCATALVDDLAPRIFRRPLTVDERTTYLSVALGVDDERSQAEGMEIALAAMLSAPQFLYRSELGEDIGGGVYRLTAYELATYLSYTFAGTTPSPSLLAAAGSGALDTPAGLRQQASQLLNSPSSRLLLNEFVNRWLGTEQLEIKEKAGISDFASLAADMKLELGKNFSHAMLDSETSFASLYNPNYTHINQRLANLYGLGYNAAAADVDGFSRVATSDRGGILTTGAFMSRYATATDANMVTRAVALRRRMMCQDIPEPPSGVSLDREALAARDREFFENPHTTQRMIFDRITSGTSCSNCHGEIINPLGGSMENFDSLGRVRSQDLKGNAIDALGTFFSPFPQLQFLNDPDRVIHSPAIQFTGGQELARTLVEDPMVSGLAQACLATQFVSYSSGIHSIFLIDSTRDVGYARISKQEEDAYRCDVSTLTDVLVTRGPRAMLEEIPALNSVIYRQEWVR